jgi:hypothetical protein
MRAHRRRAWLIALPGRDQLSRALANDARHLLGDERLAALGDEHSAVVARP